MRPSSIKLPLLFVAMSAAACAGGDGRSDGDPSAQEQITAPAEPTPSPSPGPAPTPASHASGDCASAAVREHRTLKVMTINLRNNSDQMDRRIPLLAEEIAKQDPDLVGMQEVKISSDEGDKLNAAIKAITGKAYNLVQHHKPGLVGLFGGEGIGIFSRFPIVKDDSVDIEGYRTTQIARIKLPQGGELDFFNTHLDYHSDPDDSTRLMEAKNTTKYITANETCNAKILTGDMNESDDRPAIKAFLSYGLVDSYRAVNGADSNKTGATFPIRLGDGLFTQNPDKRIDFLLTKAAGKRELKATASATYFRNHDDKGYYPSDHLGLMTTFEADL